MSGVTVLVAEDDSVTRLDVCRILERAGYLVGGEAGDGRDAVARTLELHPDVVVLDVGLPRLTGVDAAKQILARTPIPVVLLTGYGYGELVAQALEIGVSAFVTKPFHEKELLDAIRAALNRTPNDVGLSYLRLTARRGHDDSGREGRRDACA
jgi:two-component system, response regulator PdtaR